MKRMTVLTLTAALTVLGAAQAAVKLPDVNCATDKNNARCNFSSSNAGKTGTGLPFDLGGYVFLRSGFVDAANNVAYVPVDFGGQQDNQGVIFKVDLATGNRSIVSGYDGEEWHGKGLDYVNGSGQKANAYDMGRVQVVRPGPDSNSILALVDKGLQSRTEIFKVDLKTGDRSLVWANRVFDDSARDGPTSIRTIEKERSNLSSDTLCRGGDRVGLKPSETFETDGKNIYLFMVNNPAGTGTGLVKVPVTGGACTWVSQYWPDGQNVVGSGSTINTITPAIFASALVGKEFMGINGPVPDGNRLFAINVEDGTRRNVSLLNNNAPARTVGKGDAAVGYGGRMAVSHDGLAATIRKDSNDDYFEPTLVDLSNGERIGTEAKAGSLKSGRDSNSSFVAAIPGTHKFLVAFGKALHVWDAETGNSYVLSQ